MRIKLLPVLVTLFLFGSSFGIAQKANLIGIEAALTSSSAHIFNAFESGRDVSGVLNNRFKPKLNWNFAVTYERVLRKNIFFKTGIEYASHGFITREYRFFDDVGNLTEVSTDRLNIIYLGIPLSARWELPIYKVVPFLEIGLAPNIAAVNNSVSRNIQTFERERSFVLLFDRFALATNFAVGCNYVVSEEHTLYTQVHSQAMITDIYKENEIFSQLYSIGLRAGVRMTI